MRRAICTACVISLAAVASEASAQTVNGGCWVQGERADLELRASPFDSATVQLVAGELKVCFSRPRTLGRPIMGRVVPFGRPWRMGADEATARTGPSAAELVVRWERTTVRIPVALIPG